MRARLTLAGAAVMLAMVGCQPVQPADPVDDEDEEVDAGSDEPDGAAGAAPDAGSALVATLVVSSDGTAVATPILEDGRTYTMVASGEFTWGNCDATACPGGEACGYERKGDAFHRTDDCWATTIETFEYISLYVDGEQVDWGAYRSDHIYARAVLGTGASRQLSVEDCVECFGDNAGELAVKVYDGGAP